MFVSHLKTFTMGAEDYWKELAEARQRKVKSLTKENEGLIQSILARDELFNIVVKELDRIKTQLIVCDGCLAGIPLSEDGQHVSDEPADYPNLMMCKKLTPKD